MAQFRNSADIINEILQKSGEPTNGNSPYTTRAITYANKVHHAIVGGGSFLNINVDEPWVWARAHFPIVVELQPAFTTGTLNVQTGSNNISFSQAPTNPYTGSASSVEGWHIQASGLSTIYKIMQHTAGSTSAQIDSSFVDTISQASFRCFQIDYPIFPTYMYVDSSNDRFDFVENGTAGVTTSNLTAILQHGSYTPVNLASSLAALLNSTGTASYGASFDTVANTFFVTANQTFGLKGATGPNAGKRSALPSLGYDVLDQTGAMSYTGTYMPNQVGRLIEPFKMFMQNWTKENFCYSTDPIKMQEDFPISRISQRFPDRFCRISENNNGVIWVRFNAYPIQLTKLVCDWIPQPVDLQNNTASFTKLPRADVDTLIHGASAMILFDKSDSKYSGIAKFCSDGLDAMKKKNHGLLFRTGLNFGQIIPRLDLNRPLRHLDYGYTVAGGSTAVNTLAGGITTNVPAIVTYINLQSAGTTATYAATTLPNNVTLFALLIQLGTSFTGTGISGVTLNVGTVANPTQFINGFNAAQATSSSAQASTLCMYFPAVSTPIQVQIVTIGANTNALKQGSLNMFFQETVNP